MRLRISLIVIALLAGCAEQPERQSTPPAATSDANVTSATVIGQAAPGTVVTLEPAGSTDHPLPPGPAILDQYSRNFVPDLLIVRVGQRVEFRNSEDVDHNVTVVRSPTGTRVFDTSTAPYQRYEHTFDRAGRYDVSCDVHPGMRATIVATTAPHSLVVDGSGRFSFPDIAPGSYKLAASTAAGTVDRTVEVATGRVDLGALGR